ncbi:MAG TPA: ISL3 family transposase [Streptosporangiaceae bacterium]|jgi:transposase
MENGTTILFGLPGVAVERVERTRDEEGVALRLVHLVTTASSAAGCPECGVVSVSVKQRRTTRPRDLPYGEEPLAVRWRKRQYRCREQACPRTAFTESIAEIPPRARLTGRLCQQLASQVAAGRSVAAVAAQYKVSWPVTHLRYVMHADALLTEPEPPVVLGIDETRRGKPKWIQDPVTGRWVRTERFETNFTDLSGQGRLLGQVAGRTGKAVTGWLDDRGQDWKNQVGYVAIDPCAVYRSAVTKALPHAVIVVDHFHLVRLANQAVTKVRQRVTRQVLGRRGTSRDPAWANRRRLLRGRERLTDQAYARMWEEILAQEATGELLAAWIAKEELRYLLALARTRPARSEVSNRLFAFYDWCARADVPEVTTLAKTIEAWWPQILAFIDTGITNAGTEANNRLIKDAARIAFGFRNLDNQRRRVRLHCKRTMIS